MLEIAQNFEQMAPRLSPIVLIGPGLIAVIAGLFVWLGGLRFRRLLFAVLGAVSGGICGFFIIGRNIMAAAILAAAAALLATILQRFFIVILAACLAAALGLAVGHLVKPYITIPEETTPANQSKIPFQSFSLSIGESAQVMKAYITDVSEQTKQSCAQMPLYNWVIIAVLVVIFIIAGFYFWRLTSAFCCAAMGTMLIFAGMIFLLLYKGAAPFTYISRRSTFYSAVFIAMIVFGTIEQLLLCPWLKSKAITRKEAKKDKTALSRHSWRTS